MSDHPTWRLIGGGSVAILFAVLAWAARYTIVKVDGLSVSLQAQAVAIEGLAKTLSAQNDRYFDLISGMDRRLDEAERDAKETENSDRQALREEIRAALAARGVGR